MQPEVECSRYDVFPPTHATDVKIKSFHSTVGSQKRSRVLLSRSLMAGKGGIVRDSGNGLKIRKTKTHPAQRLGCTKSRFFSCVTVLVRSNCIHHSIKRCL